MSDTFGTLKGSKFARINTLKKDPVVHSVLTKLVEDRSGVTTNRGRRNDGAPSDLLMQMVSSKTTQNINDIENIFQLLPDTELAMQVLVSSILSPKDMVNIELNYTVDSRVFEGEVSGVLLEVITKYFEESYKLKEILPTILEQALFKKGSYPLMVIPESTLDDIINSKVAVGMESLKEHVHTNGTTRSLGLLGNNQKTADKWSLESFIGNTSQVSSLDEIVVDDSKIREKVKTDLGKVYVTDNFDTPKMSKVIEKIRKNKLRDAMGLRKVSLESKRKKETINSWEMKNVLYNNSYHQSNPFIRIHTRNESEQEGMGHPLVMKLPPESVIPVHTPSNPEDHVGYFVLLDVYGNPINKTKESDYYKNLSSNVGRSGISSQMLEQTAISSHGFRNYEPLGDQMVSESVRLYSEIVERDLLARLKNGIYGENVELSRPEDVYRIMFSRSLANMDTQVMFVPVELVTYFAFKYTEYGVGKTLLDDNKILAGIRSVLLFSNTMGAVKNSISKTNVEITLDPEDPSPSETVDQMLAEYAKHRSASFPLGSSNPSMLVDHLQNAGIDVQVSGNPLYPETRLSASDTSHSKVQVDSDLEEDIKRRYFMGLGLSPETIDMTTDVEFATSIATSNLLLSKRVMLYGTQLCSQLKDHIVKYVLNSEVLLSDLSEAIKSNKRHLPKALKKLDDKEVLETFFESFEVSLPKPDSSKLENQIQAYDLYSNAVETALDAYIGRDGFAIDGFDDVEGNIDVIREALLSHYKREWLRSNNVLPELMDIVTDDENGNPRLNIKDIHGNHMNQLGRSIMGLLKKLKREQIKREKQMEIIENLGEEEEEPEEEVEDNESEPDEGEEETPQEENSEGEPEEESESTEPEEEEVDNSDSELDKLDKL